MSKTKLGQVVFPPKGYELIETINIEAGVSAVSRNLEPDGTKFNFREAMITADFAASTNTGDLAIYYFYNTDYSGCIQSWFINPYKNGKATKGFSKIWNNGGFWETGIWQCVNGSGDTGIRYDNPYYNGRFPAVEGKGISSIMVKGGLSATTISAGTVIKIYAIRF